MNYGQSNEIRINNKNEHVIITGREVIHYDCLILINSKIQKVIQKQHIQILLEIRIMKVRSQTLRIMKVRSQTLK